MKQTIVTWTCLLAATIGLTVTWTAGAVEQPTLFDNRVMDVRQAFLGLPRPLGYEMKSKHDYVDTLTWIVLTGETAQFANKYSTNELIYALWPYLDNHEYNAEAAIILLGTTGRKFLSPLILTYKDRRQPGNWSYLRSDYLDNCKIACRTALKQPNWWYPHKVFFDRKTVLAESKTNAIVRAAYVAAMQKALADPKIRTENPLEVHNIISCLYILDKKAAVSNFVDYIFYDFKNGGDLRRKHEKLTGNDILVEGHPVGLVAFGNMGDEYLPLVLERFSKATPEERSIEVGGGAMPMLAIYYFHSIRYSEEQALKAIESFKTSNTNLTKEQIAALDEIGDAIRTKKYRPDYFRMHELGRPDWSAPSPTNSLSHQ